MAYFVFRVWAHAGQDCSVDMDEQVQCVALQATTGASSNRAALSFHVAPLSEAVDQLASTGAHSIHAEAGRRSRSIATWSNRIIARYPASAGRQRIWGIGVTRSARMAGSIGSALRRRRCGREAPRTALPTGASSQDRGLELGAGAVPTGATVRRRVVCQNPKASPLSKRPRSSWICSSMSSLCWVSSVSASCSERNSASN